MTGIEITASNFESWALDGGLRRMAALGQQPRPLWEAIGQYGESSTKLRFARGYGPDRKPWIPSVRVRTQGGQTLRLKNHLMNSVTHNADNQGTSWGTNKIYAAPNQFGAVIKAKSGGALRFRMPGGNFVTVKKVTIPARPFVGLNEDDGREILMISNDAVDQAARNRGSA